MPKAAHLTRPHTCALVRPRFHADVGLLGELAHTASFTEIFWVCLPRVLWSVRSSGVQAVPATRQCRVLVHFELECDAGARLRACIALELELEAFKALFETVKCACTCIVYGYCAYSDCGYYGYAIYFTAIPSICSGHERCCCGWGLIPRCAHAAERSGSGQPEIVFLELTGKCINELVMHQYLLTRRQRPVQHQYVLQDDVLIEASQGTDAAQGHRTGTLAPLMAA
ncbi:hypothetical protein BKA93DRAFT_867800 [Sparassis latifolia]